MALTYVGSIGYVLADSRDKYYRAKKKEGPRAAKVEDRDAIVSDDGETGADQVSGMEMIDLDDDVPEGTSPVDTVAETPVEEPSDDVAEGGESTLMRQADRCRRS